MEQNQTSPGLLLMNNNEQTINKEQAQFYWHFPHLYDLTVRGFRDHLHRLQLTQKIKYKNNKQQK